MDWELCVQTDKRLLWRCDAFWQLQSAWRVATLGLTSLTHYSKLSQFRDRLFCQLHSSLVELNQELKRFCSVFIMLLKGMAGSTSFGKTLITRILPLILHKNSVEESLTLLRLSYFWFYLCLSPLFNFLSILFSQYLINAILGAAWAVAMVIGRWYYHYEPK